VNIRLFSYTFSSFHTFLAAVVVRLVLLFIFVCLFHVSSSILFVSDQRHKRIHRLIAFNSSTMSHFLTHVCDDEENSSDYYPTKKIHSFRVSFLSVIHNTTDYQGTVTQQWNYLMALPSTHPQMHAPCSSLSNDSRLSSTCFLLLFLLLIYILITRHKSKIYVIILRIKVDIVR